MTLFDEVRTVQGLPRPARARAIREAAGVSQERLAQELNVHRITVHRWEHGERSPRGKTRMAYAELLEGLRNEVLG